MEVQGTPANSDRANWTDSETDALIQLWEENLTDLRGQKRNGKIYAAITASLADCGIHKTRAQVHSKIENLRSKYRSVSKKKTTGSGGVTWRLYWKLHSFLGSLPCNDPSLAVESSCEELSVSRIIRSMETGEEIDHSESPEEDQASCSAVPYEEEVPNRSPSPSYGADTQSAGNTFTDEPATAHSAPGTSRQQPSCPSRQDKRKRPRRDSLLGELIEQQKALQASWEDAKREELAIQNKQLKLQEDAGKRDQELINLLRSFLSGNGASDS